MPLVKFIENVFEGGVIKYKIDDELEVDPSEVERMQIRGWAKELEPAKTDQKAKDTKKG